MKKWFYGRGFLTEKMLVWIAWGLLLVMMVFYAIWMCDQSILRYTTFKATAFDLGNFDQALWNTLHGRPFQFTNHGSDWYGYPIRLAQHVEPIIFPLSLVYLIYSDPRTILVVQALSMTLGAIPVFLLTRRFIPMWPLLAPIMVAGYFFSPSLIGVTLFDFHPVALTTALLLYALLALAYRRMIWFVILCFLAAMCKEEVPAVVALLGLLVLWKYRRPRLGLILFLTGILVCLIFFVVVEPRFNLGAHQNNFWYRYRALGETPGKAVINVLLHPWLPLVVFATPDRFFYLFSLLRSTGFFALLAPEWLLPTGVNLAINLLSMQSPQHSGVYHYNAPLIPFFMLAAIHGVRRLVLLWYRWSGDSEKIEQLREPAILFAPANPLPSVQFPVILTSKLRGFSNWWQVNSKRVLTWGPVQQLRLGLAERRQQLNERGSDWARVLPLQGLQALCLFWIVAMIVFNYCIMLPQMNIFWPDHRPGVHEQRIEQILKMIPPDAVVSAGGTLNPHLTQRRYITVFPELSVALLDGGHKPVDYIIVDLQAVSPEDTSRSATFLNVLNQIERSHQFHVIAEADGVILLARNQP